MFVAWNIKLLQWSQSVLIEMYFAPYVYSCIMYNAYIICICNTLIIGLGPSIVYKLWLCATPAWTTTSLVYVLSTAFTVCGNYHDQVTYNNNNNIVITWPSCDDYTLSTHHTYGKSNPTSYMIPYHVSITTYMWCIILYICYYITSFT